MKNFLIISVIVVVLAAGSSFYVWQSGPINPNYQIPEVRTEHESATRDNATAPASAEPDSKLTGTPIAERSFTVEEAKAKPTLCEKDSDCKIIPITCNKCDCGRAVNSWIEPYACTKADRANPCEMVCQPSKAVCDNGVCKKVPA